MKVIIGCFNDIHNVIESDTTKTKVQVSLMLHSCHLVASL
uniref:Uncharacterized protein n=1 Tax=Anguilla anguilla TaxID=7936 RepID=A0A0E9UDP8_ANGAN